MEIEEMNNLQSGDEVQWNDPDNGKCSRIVTIESIDTYDNAARITCDDGSVIEAFAWELS